MNIEDLLKQLEELIEIKITTKDECIKSHAKKLIEHTERLIKINRDCFIPRRPSNPWLPHPNTIPPPLIWF